MALRTLMLLLASLASTQVLAEACDVTTRSSSQAITPVERHSCYSYSNMPAEAIGWSCSNESKEMLNTEKRRVPACGKGSVGSCIAPLSQETLANAKAAGSPESDEHPAVPKDARITTYYYDTPSLGQAREDCQRNNGVWQTH